MGWILPTAHPRIRGERFLRLRIMCRYVGSSPHTRGTRPLRDDVEVNARFIPAYAGNAQCSVFRSIEGAVHPRIRGERSSNNNNFFNGDGSSPHTRGTRGAAGEEPGQPRFIPAYAGNAAGRESRACPRTVHPRIRGERALRGLEHLAEHGSSPHTRGTPGFLHYVRHFHRFIPAYAGNAPRTRAIPGSSSVHPRIRGERTKEEFTPFVESGSSPHTRGTRVARLHDAVMIRFIPAYAGNALVAMAALADGQVHPRIRGERRNAAAIDQTIDGSSPHTRGTLLGHPEPEIIYRFIPAYAGNAWMSR